jgi:hypothetical protein
VDGYFGRETGQKVGKSRRGVVGDVTGIDIACLIDELALFPVER